MLRICAILLLLLTPLPSVAEVAGRVQVIDGDTIDVGGARVRLYGIDAPEIGQPCRTDRGEVRDCGIWARDQVRRMYQGRRARCEPLDRDIYGRIVARCAVRGEDMGARIVGEGVAFAFRRYSMDYDLTEKQAAVAGVGLWSMTVQSPAAYRDRSGSEVTGDCVIKGNISDAGRIYHMPYNRDYGRTRINEARGERWFCTEAEARAAGWRPARN